jgi:hypothetical protein
MFPKFAQPEPTHLVIPRKAAFSKMGIGSYLEKGYFRETKVKQKKQKTTTKKTHQQTTPGFCRMGFVRCCLKY